MTVNITDELERSFGEGPEPRPVTDHLVAGRRALKRRRTLTGLVAFAALAVVGTAAVVVGGPSPASEPQVASDPSSSPSSSPTPTPTPSGPPTPSDPDADVELLADGTLALAPGVEVLEQVDNPLGRTAPDRSLGVAYTRGGAETWTLLDVDVEDDGKVATVTGTSDPAGKAYDTLADWLEFQVAVEDGDQGGLPQSRLVELGDGETLVPLDGVEILEQTSDVDLPENFAGPGDRVAAALVELDGTRWYVLARQVDGSDPEYIPTAFRVGGPTLDDFLAYAQAQYGGGEGLL